MSFIAYKDDLDEKAAARERALFRTKCVEEIFNELPNRYDPDEINGVIVPRDVRLQLRDLGISLGAYTRGQLLEAIAACADGTLIDDPNGVTFEDKLSLTPDEVAERNALKDMDSDDDGIPDCDDDAPNYDQHGRKSLARRIIEERMRKITAIAFGNNGNGDITIK